MRRRVLGMPTIPVVIRPAGECLADDDPNPNDERSAA
jgi:hypothetical protein